MKTDITGSSDNPSEPTVYVDVNGEFNIADTYGCDRLEFKYCDYQGLETGYFLIGYRNTQSVILYQYLISCVDENEPLLTDTWKTTLQVDGTCRLVILDSEAIENSVGNISMLLP